MNSIIRSLLPTALFGFSILSPEITLAEGNVVSIQQVFNEAIRHRKEGNLQESIEIFNEILAKNPDRSRVRLELATAYYQAGDYSSAKKQINIVLSEASLPENVRSNSQKFLTKIQRRLAKNSVSSRHRLSGKVKLSLGDDSNANIAPEDTSLDIGTLPRSLLSKRDNYSTSSFYLGHQYLLKKPLAEDELFVYWKNGLSAFSRNYSKENGSDIQVVSAYTGFATRSPKNWRNDLKLKADYIRVENDPLAYYYSALYRSTYAFDSVSFSVAPLYTYRSYINTKDKGSEGRQFGLEFSAIAALSESLIARIGVDVRDTSLNDDYRSYQGYSFSALLSKEFSEKWTVSLNGEYENNSYDAEERLYQDSRRDEIFEISAGVEYLMTENIPVGLNYTYIDRDSNHDIHSYSRSRIEAFISYKF